MFFNDLFVLTSLFQGRKHNNSFNGNLMIRYNNQYEYEFCTKFKFEKRIKLLPLLTVKKNCKTFSLNIVFFQIIAKF